MFTKVERLISSRNLRPKKKEGFLKIISIFSFLGIMLGVAILIIVMSVMNGFKTELTNKILGLNPHIVVQPNGFKIDDIYMNLLIFVGFLIICRYIFEIYKSISAKKYINPFSAIAHMALGLLLISISLNLSLIHI